MPVFALALVAALAPGWHGERPAPRAAFEPARLTPLPERAVVVCKRMPARALCPRRLPRPFLAIHGRGRPPFRTEVFTAGGGGSGIEFAYSAAAEPTFRGWRRHVWWNRPCCSLHFTIQWFEQAGSTPRGARRAFLGGRRGWLLPAVGYGFGRRGDAGRGDFWPNHTYFVWRANGVRYAASLHVFGRNSETRRLLARLIRELRPARQFR